MAEQSAAAAAGTPPAFDQAAFAAELNKSIGASIAAAVKPLHEEIAKLKAPPAAEAAKETAATAPKPLSAEDVVKLLDARDAKRSKSDARHRHANEKMKDLPESYRNQLPDTDDAAQLASAEQTIRTQYRTDLKAAGFTPKDVSAAPGGATSAVEHGKVDWSKAPASKKIESLVGGSRPSFSGTTKAEGETAANA